MRRTLMIVALVGLLTGCASTAGRSTVPSTGATQAPTPNSTPTSSPSGDRAAGWASDLDAIVPGLERLHPDPYHSTSKSAMLQAVSELKASIPTASDDALMAGVVRLIAMVSSRGRDAHTGAYVWGSGEYATHTLPLRLWLFPEGVVVADALPPYVDLVGRTVVSIDGRAIADVEALLDPLIPRDNPQTVTLLMPRFLLTTELLHGAGVINDPAHVSLGFADSPAATAVVDAIPTADYNAWATPYGLFLPTRDDVPYLARSTEPIWWRMDSNATLYIQYNRVTRLSETDLSALGAAVVAPGIRRAVVDIRHNFGGETFGYPPVVDALLTGASRWSDGLFLITGRNTFSAASLFAASLASRTAVTMVGEVMGGSPSLYGNARDLRLPYSGIVISVATEFFEPVAGDQRLEVRPDRPVALHLTDFLAGRDPALAAIEGGN